MPTDDYVQHFEVQLGQVDKKLAKAQAAFETGNLEQKAEALAELTRLRQRHDELVERIGGAKEDGATDWSTLHTSFREEIDGLADTLERFITRFC